MARPKKATDYTPNLREFRAAIEAYDTKITKRYFRNSSSAYIKKPAVRAFVFDRDAYACVFCGSTENLQPDHITPVYLATADNIHTVNSLDNLRTFCGSCNAGRSPNVAS